MYYWSHSWTYEYVVVWWSDYRNNDKLVVQWLRKVPANDTTDYLRAVTAGVGGDEAPPDTEPALRASPSTNRDRTSPSRAMYNEDKNEVTFEEAGAQ